MRLLSRLGHDGATALAGQPGSPQEQRVSALFVTHPELTALGCALAAALVTFLAIWAWAALVWSLAGPSAAGMRKSRSENTADLSEARQRANAGRGI
jgi:hypothetical protein